MTTLLIVLAGIAAYFVTGVVIARVQLPQSWAASRREWTYDDSAREGVMIRFALTVLFWPAVVPFFMFTRWIRGAVDDGDPKRLQEENDDLRHRIAELERELGVGR